MIERDGWLYVWVDSAEAARRFFGVPETTEVRLHRELGEQKCWAVRGKLDEVRAVLFPAGA